MDVQEQIQFLSGSEHRIELLDLLEAGPKGVDGLAERLDVSKRTISRHSTTLADLNWIKENKENLTITSAGRVVLREYQKARGEIGRKGLVFLSGGKEASRPPLLRGLAQPMTKPELADQCQVSTATVYRGVIREEGFVDKGWALRRGDGKYVRNDEGEDILTAYENLAHSVGLVDECGVVLEYLNTNPPPPMYVLEDASTKALDLGVAHDGLDRCVDAIRKEPTHVRATARTVSGPLVRLGMQLLENRVEMEVVFDEHTLKNYWQKHPDDLKRSLEVSNVEMYCQPEKFNIQIAIFDDEHLLLGVYDEHGRLVGGIDGTDDKVVTWGRKLFERYREKARPLSRQQLDDIIDTVRSSAV